MASRGLGYNYGTGGFGAGGKIRLRAASRAAAASPYARPAPAPAPAAATAATSASQGCGWFSRLISAGASRLLPSLFRKPPPQLAAPPPPPEPLDATNMGPEVSQEPLLLPRNGGTAFVQTQLEPPNAPPSPPPPPLEDDLPEIEENGGAVANILGTENSSNDRDENMPINSDEHSLLDLEDLLKQRTFKRNEFEYLSELLWSRTVGSNSLKPNNSNLNKMQVSEKETGSMRSNLPADFPSATCSVSDLVASPAEIAKAYMGSKSANGPALRLRLHDPSSLTVKSVEANMIPQARPPTVPLQGSRLYNSKNSDHFKSNFSTPNRSAINKMSSSPYFKNAASSYDLSSTISSSHRTPSRVHTFGRQVMKRKSSAVNNENVSVSPMRKMRQRYNRTSPLLETRAGYRGHLASHGSKLNKDSEYFAQTKRRRCLSKDGDATPSDLDDKASAASFGQAPVQSAEMAALILKQLDTLVPSQKEASPITSLKDKPLTFSSRSHPPNLVLSSEVDRNKIPITSNGFTFPIPAVLGAQSQAPPTPTMTSPPILPIGKLQQSVAPSASVTSVESGARIPKSVLEEGSIADKHDQLNADDQLMSSKRSGQVPPFTSKPVFKFTNSKSLNLSNGLQHTSNSVASDIHPTCGSIIITSSPSPGSDTISTSSTTVPAQSISTGGDISSSGTGSLSSITGATAKSFPAPSLASSGDGSGSASFSFFPKFGATSSSATQDNSKAVPSSTFKFSQQFGTSSSFGSQDKSKAASPETTFFSGNQHTQPGNSNVLFTQNSAHGLSYKPSEKPNSQSLANSPVVSASLGSPFSASSLLSSAAGSGSTLVTATVPPFSPISSSASGSGPVFSESPVFGSKLTTTATGLPNYGSASSPLSSAPSAAFSFNVATPSIPNPSPTAPMFGVSPATGSATGIGQMNGGNMCTDKKGPPFLTTCPGIPSNSPSTPIFSSPATQFAPTTSASTEIFKFGEHNASSGGFSIGSGGGNEKSGRKFIRVKRRK